MPTPTEQAIALARQYKSLGDIMWLEGNTVVVGNRLPPGRVQIQPEYLHEILLAQLSTEPEPADPEEGGS